MHPALSYSCSFIMILQEMCCNPKARCTCSCHLVTLRAQIKHHRIFSPANLPAAQFRRWQNQQWTLRAWTWMIKIIFYGMPSSSIAQARLHGHLEDLQRMEDKTVRFISLIFVLKLANLPLFEAELFPCDGLMSDERSKQAPCKPI